MIQIFFNGILGVYCVVVAVEPEPTAVCVDVQTDERFTATATQVAESALGVEAMGIDVEILPVKFNQHGETYESQ